MHMSFPNHWHPKPPFLWKRVLFELANIQRLPCILLSVDFTLHKINLFYVLKMFTFIFSDERMIILRAIRTQRTNISFYFPILK